MGNVIPGTFAESGSDEQLIRSLDSQATLQGPPLTPANNKFLRSLKCRRSGEVDSTLVKVFFVKNLDLSIYKDKLKIQKSLLSYENAPNVLAYQRFREGAGPGTPAFVARQYFFANLKDRLSTRPFLSDAEKLWIAFGIISAGAQLHSVGLGHGDIKSENVVLTSWGWPILTDLASFKPVFMQADQSAAPFNFFFSTGKKRCYLAPERFVSSSSISSSSSTVKSSSGSSSTSTSTVSKENAKRRFMEAMQSKDVDMKKTLGLLADSAGLHRSDRDEKQAQLAFSALLHANQKLGMPADMEMSNWRRDVNEELMPSMDVFSVGCVLAELFNADAEATFELSDALMYAARGESPRLFSLLSKIEDPGIRSLVESMTKHDPSSRLRLQDYLDHASSNVFPKSFKTFLYPFMQSFLKETNTEEALVWRTCERYGDIVRHLLGKKDELGESSFKGIFKAKVDRESPSSHLKRHSSNAKTPTPTPPSTTSSSASSSSSSHPPPHLLQSAQSSTVVLDSDDMQFNALDEMIRDMEHKLNQASGGGGSGSSTNIAAERGAVYGAGREDVSDAGRRAQPFASTEEANDENIGESSFPSPLVIVMSYLCISVQYASRASTRVLALLLLKRLSLLEGNSELILSRILPFVVDRLQDTSVWVRCTTLTTLTELLENCCATSSSSSTRKLGLPASEYRIFPDFLLPTLADCARDSSEAVRVTFATCLPTIATCAKRFLEMARHYQNNQSQSSSNNNVSSSSAAVSSSLPSYDAELGLLHDTIQKMIERTVASEHVPGGGADIAVKAALVSQVMKLCLFFGRDRIDRWLLLWLLSVVNTRGPGNWRLQVAVLRSLASVGAFIGDEAFDQYLLPLIDDMLSSVSSQDLVIEASANCLTSLVTLNLLKNIDMFKLVKKVGPLTRHPSIRVRRSAILLLAAIASSKLLNHVDVQLFVAEKLKQFLSPKNNNESEKFIILLGKEGQTLEVNSMLLEQCLDLDSPIESYQEWVQTFAQPTKKISNSSSSTLGQNGRPTSSTQNPSGSFISSSKILEKDFKGVVRVHTLKTNESNGSGAHSGGGTGSSSNSSSHGSHVDMTSLKAVRNRFGIVLEEFTTAKSLLKRARALGLPETRLNLGKLKFQHDTASPSVPSAATTSGGGRLSNLSTGQVHDNNSSSTSSGKPSSGGNPPSATSVATGKSSHNNNHGKQALAASPSPAPSSSYSPNGGGTSQGGAGISFHVPGPVAAVHGNGGANAADWKPRGLLVTSLHEHAGPVNRISVSDDSSFFATGSDDGTAKVWKTDKMDRNPIPRSRVTFETQGGGRVIDVCTIRQTTSVAVASDNGKVSIFRVETANADSHRNLKTDSTRLVAVGCVSTNDLYATSERGTVLHWDMRSGSKVDDMSLTLGFGSVSCMAVSPDNLWLALGTHRGVIAIFDLRYNILITAWRHPCSCAIHRLYIPRTTEGLPLIFVAAGPNQAVMLNVETGQTQTAFACAISEYASDKAKLAEWKASQESLFAKSYEAIDLNARQIDRYLQEAKFASSSIHATAFSSPHHSIRAMLCPADALVGGGGMEPPSLLTAGTDRIVRYWDCQFVQNSGVVTAPQDEPKIRWETKDFSNKQSQMFLSLSGPKNPSIVTSRSKSKFVVRPSHADAILDLNLMRMPSDSSPHMITAGRDSVVRLWK